MTAIIALCGPAGSGKSTVAKHLVDVYGAVSTSFAAPLKLMVGRALDLTPEQLYGTQEQKEAIDPRYGHSARWFLQRIGTEGCRRTFGEDFWTKQTIEYIRQAKHPFVVIEDLRFANEAKAVLGENAGFVWRLWPVDDAVSAERATAAGAHPSEEQWRTLEANLEIKPPKRGIPELLELVDKAMRWKGLPDIAGLSW